MTEQYLIYLSKDILNNNIYIISAEGLKLKLQKKVIYQRDNKENELVYKFFYKKKRLYLFFIFLILILFYFFCYKYNLKKAAYNGELTLGENIVDDNFFIIDSNNLNNVVSHMYGFSISKKGFITDNYYKQLYVKFIKIHYLSIYSN